MCSSSSCFLSRRRSPRLPSLPLAGPAELFELTLGADLHVSPRSAQPATLCAGSGEPCISHRHVPAHGAVLAPVSAPRRAPTHAAAGDNSMKRQHGCSVRESSPAGARGRAAVLGRDPAPELVADTGTRGRWGCGRCCPGTSGSSCPETHRTCLSIPRAPGLLFGLSQCSLAPSYRPTRVTQLSQGHTEALSPCTAPAPALGLK